MRPWFVLLILFAFPAGCLEGGPRQEVPRPCEVLDQDAWRSVLRDSRHVPPDLIPEGRVRVTEGELGRPLVQVWQDDASWGMSTTHFVTTWTSKGWVVHERYQLFEEPPGRALCAIPDRIIDDDRWAANSQHGERIGPVHAAPLPASQHAAMQAWLVANNLTAGRDASMVDDGPSGSLALHWEAKNGSYIAEPQPWYTRTICVKDGDCAEMGDWNRGPPGPAENLWPMMRLLESWLLLP